MAERCYQIHVKTKLKKSFPGCIVLKNDPNIIQGIPDLTVLYENKWAFLEVKDHKDANVQPNQTYYISKAQKDSYGSFIYPENEDEVFDQLSKHFLGNVL